MMSKVIRCDVKGCTERQEVIEEESFLLTGWVIRQVTDTVVLHDGSMMGEQQTRHYCPAHGLALSDVCPRVSKWLRENIPETERAS